MCSSSEFSIVVAQESSIHPPFEEVKAWVASEDGRATMAAQGVIRALQNGLASLTFLAELPLGMRVTYPLSVSSTVPEHQVFASTIPASVPASPPAESAPLLTDQQFHEELEAWVASEGGRARAAALKIERAFQNKSASLDLSYLRLKTLPTVIGQLLLLQKLNLSGNQLTTLPAEFGQLLQLKELYLNSNQLTTFPAVIGQLLQLRELRLSSNQLTALPAVIGQLLQLQVLYLHSNQLTTLPAEIGQLLQLRELRLSSNQLTTFPPEICQLTQLKKLDLDLNRLTTLPAVIGQLLQLEMLHLNSNRLTTLPPEIGQLRQLKILRIYSNRLTILPAVIGQLLRLRTFDFSNNPAVSEIPIVFCNMLNITDLDIHGTSVPSAQRELILDIIQRQRGATAAERLPKKINLWENYALMSGLNLDTSVLDPVQKESLYEWLVRLEKARDFQRSQQSLCETACRILCTVLEDRTFRDTFFAQVSGNLEGCGDRAAMSFNEIYTAWRLATLPRAATIRRKLAILTGIAKTNTLRSCLQQSIDRHEIETGMREQENVEIYLYYENRLREELSLVSAIQDMLYAPTGQREWIDIRDLTRQVMEFYLDELIQIPAFDALIKQDLAFMRQWAPVEDQFQEQLASLSEDVTSEELLTRSREIQEARDLAWKTAATQWLVT